MTPLVYAYRPQPNRLTIAECVAAFRCDRSAALIPVFMLAAPMVAGLLMECF